MERMVVDEDSAETPAKLISFVIRVVCERYDVDYESRRFLGEEKDLNGKKNNRIYSKVRKICAYIILEITDIKNHHRISECMEYRNATLLREGAAITRENMKHNAILKKEVEEIKNMILKKAQKHQKYKDFLNNRHYGFTV